MRRRQSVFEPVGFGGQECPRLFRDVRRMIAQPSKSLSSAMNSST
jgi:hypothetical protein